MSQPKWKYLDNLGDASPLEYGGYFIFEDETGVYAPEAEYLYVPDIEGEETVVYRFSLDKCTYIDGVLSDNKFHPDHPAWFAKPETEFVNRPQDTTYLSRIADQHDMTVAELAAKFCSDDVRERAWAYREVGEYHGFENLDSDPLELSEDELNTRYANIGFGALPEKIRIIREIKAEVQKRLDSMIDGDPSLEFYRGHNCGYRSALTFVQSLLNHHDTHSVGTPLE